MNKFIILIIILELMCINQENGIIMDDIYNNRQKLKEQPIFSASSIPNNIYEKMLGKSIPIEYRDEVDINQLRYLQITYYGFDKKTHKGEMIVNVNLAQDVLDIFKELYEIKYPIEKINLIDEYDADDEISMSDNNTSCFCYRVISGTNNLSNHANGTAIDINPLYNPYIVNDNVTPVSGAVYANRELNQEYQIDENDALYKIFTDHGWEWGGNWSNKKDYQHFEKSIK